MTKSIFLTVKKLLGISEEYHAFDIDILTAINATFLTLNQLGIGPLLPFQLPLILPYEDEEEFQNDPAVTTTWEDFLGDQYEHLAAVQTYVYQRVRLIFDPPTNSFMVTAMQESCKEFEWRFTVQPKTMGAVEDVEKRKFVYDGDKEPEDEDWGLEPPPTTEPTNPDEPKDPIDPNNPDDLYEIFG